ncbi:hypothetical protein Q0F98_27345 [Paenibacillus amylolyticus]|nr:hypothetical protein Q0F98_27345 [Paenibacillus amylolyticus]
MCCLQAEGLPVTLDLARMLHRAGHRVYVAESAARHLTRSSSAVEQCAVVPSPRHDTRAYLGSWNGWFRLGRLTC